MINLYAFNICDTLKHNGFVIDFIDLSIFGALIVLIENNNLRINIGTIGHR